MAAKKRSHTVAPAGKTRGPKAGADRPPPVIIDGDIKAWCAAIDSGRATATPFSDFVGIVARVPGVPKSVHGACALAWLELLPPGHDATARLERRLTAVLRKEAKEVAATPEGQALLRPLIGAVSQARRRSTMFLIGRPVPSKGTAPRKGKAPRKRKALAAKVRLIHVTVGRKSTGGRVAMLQAVLRDLLAYSPDGATADTWETLPRLLRALGLLVSGEPETLKVNASRGAKHFGHRVPPKPDAAAALNKMFASEQPMTRRSIVDDRTRSIVRTMIATADEMLRINAMVPFPPPAKRGR